MHIRKGSAEIVIPFENEDDLKKKLDEIPSTIKVLEEKLGKLEVVRKPKVGFEDLHRFTEDNLVELSKVPPSNLDTIILAMFFNHPNLMKSEDLERATGISSVADYLTKTKYKKYFQQHERGVYSLLKPAIDLAVNQIIPKLRETTQSQTQPQPKE